MVKIVDNYVLERVIGKGQFGEVYKGYHKSTGEDVAVKAVNRKSLKGKFYELLENEIKVLKSCDNVNIIKLYDIKKTSNNIYLMLEYCNEGDLMQYLKKRGKLTEEEAVDIFVQILNAFKTLVKNKIMHRDFKLANILKHNGIVKVADFGFAKILDDDAYAKTMLGSPLNMAPEILGGKDYNNKADIWSLGTCLYELLFGAPPYTAKNIVELLQKIQRTPFELPKSARLSPEVEDVLRRMLVFRPDQRIEWDDLFAHKVTKVAEEQILRDLEATIHNQDIENISRFYIKNNKVIDHVAEIEQKKDINEFAYGATRQKDTAFKGQLVNRRLNREAEEPGDAPPGPPREGLEPLPTTETERERAVRIFKQNSSRVLHERNKYVFLASVAEDSVALGYRLSDLLGYVLIKKLFRMLCELKFVLEGGQNAFGLELWPEYVLTRDFKKICNYIFKEYDLFKSYFENLNNNVKAKAKTGDAKAATVERLVKAGSEEQINDCLRRLLRDYVEGVFGGGPGEHSRKRKEVWIHLNQLLDCLNSDAVFFFDQKGKKQFNFKLFYEEVKSLDTDEVAKIVQAKLAAEGINID